MNKTATGNWFAVYRGDMPLAMFKIAGLATEWANSAKHRCKDRVHVVPVVDGNDLPPHIVTKAHRRAANLCVRCGDPAQLYSGKDNYSAQCMACNEVQSEKRRAASARRRARG